MRDNLVPRMLEIAFQSLQISKFSGGVACPPDPPRLMANLQGSGAARRGAGGSDPPLFPHTLGRAIAVITQQPLL